MNIEVIEKEGLKRDLNIEIPADIVDQEYTRVYTEFGRKAKIKGFRPGKIPTKVIRNKFKREATEDVVDNLVNKYLGEAIEEKKLAVVGTPVLSKIDIDEGKPLIFTVGVEIMPDIENVAFNDLKIISHKIEIADEEVDKVIADLRKNSADIRTVDRPAGESDILICDMEISEGDIDAEKLPLTGQEIDLDNEYTISEFRDALKGASRNDTREVTIDYPDDYPDDKFAGKMITYKLLVKEVKERILPILNDDFAKLMNQGETLLELRLNIRKRLEQDVENEQKRGHKKTLIDQVVAQNPMDVPESMVTSYLNGVVKDLKQDKPDAKEDEIREKYRPVGVNAVKWYLLFHRLAVQEKIEVSKEDTEKWIERFAENYRMEVAQANQILAKTGKADDIKDGILEEKIIDFLMSKAEIERVTEENKEGNS